MNSTPQVLPKNDAEYFALDRLSHSGAKNFKRSPRHFLHEKNTPTEPTAAMIYGSAYHCIILEEDEFNNRYAAAPVCDRRTTKGKADWEIFSGLNEGKKILTADQMEMLKLMKESIMKCEPARELLNAITKVEVPLLWTEKVSGVEMKGKLDAMDNSSFLLDLKSCMNATPEIFHKTILHDYVMQGPIYLDGAFNNKMGERDFYFIACEKEAPYAVSVHKLSGDIIKYGMDQYRNLCNDFAYWQEIGSPDLGYEFRRPLGFFQVELPTYLK